MRIRIFSKKDCHLCEEAKAVLIKFSARYPMVVEEIDIERDPVAFEKYHDEITVIFLENRKLFKYRIDEVKLEKALRSSMNKD